MTTKKMTPEEEHEFYAQPANQVPQGPARRRRSNRPKNDTVDVGT